MAQIMGFIRARTLVDSGRFEPGDWRPWDDETYTGPANPYNEVEDECDCFQNCDYDYTHLCTDQRSRWQQIMNTKRRELSDVFVSSILATGVQEPVNVERIPFENRLVLRNGHHRIAVAYEHDMVVPVIMGSDHDYKAFELRQRLIDDLPYSTEEDL